MNTHPQETPRSEVPADALASMVDYAPWYPGVLKMIEELQLAERSEWHGIVDRHAKITSDPEQFARSIKSLLHRQAA